MERGREGGEREREIIANKKMLENYIYIVEDGRWKKKGNERECKVNDFVLLTNVADNHQVDVILLLSHFDNKLCDIDKKISMKKK